MEARERLTILLNVIKWNLELAHIRRKDQSLEGHRDCDRMIKNARSLMPEVVALEKELGL